MIIPEAAVEAAAKAMSANWKRMHTNESLGFQRMLAEYALEAAAPHMLSHEREETRLAHLDAVVNRETSRAQLAEAWDEGEHAGYLNRGAEEFGMRRPNPYR